VPSPVATKVTPPKPKLTSAQQQAVGSAQDYLSFEAFSRKGLIEQLKFEQFSTKDATIAVDSMHINFYAQAVKTAKSYLSQEHFSRGGLIDQLKFEGYSTAQATYGVKHSGL
jgi:hypothetical protein